MSKADDFPMTTTQAAKYLKLAPNTVFVYVQRGILKARKVGPINLISRTECDRYLRERRPRGNPNLHKTSK
jgi:excisionase family DNA binding protein